ncbi:AMP-dependent synthetase [Methylobacterium brachiatum]|uniref:AMP-dependent synthetase n=1 Tax=Methylobacterium brachiatum TaxID=269660 RepID=UPI000EFCAFF0|nr:AMP-dependent synthetase [Methylobacterium brachiatum]AYO82722.1 AMP-dependent synthetase [Methylobacterium brachiatum]MCB4804871.1 AMP-dependent synthetase [Methylobacterium brachiatum]
MFGVNSTVADIPVPAPGPRDPDRRFRSGLGLASGDRRATPAICPNRVAHWAFAEGLRAGETVALLVRDLSQAEAMRLGLARIGVRVLALDGSRRGEALADSLARSGATLVIIDTALADAYAGVMGRLPSYPSVWWNGPGADFASLDLALAEQD